VPPTIVGEVFFISAQVGQRVIEFISVDLIYAETNRGRLFNLGGYGITHNCG